MDVASFQKSGQRFNSNLDIPQNAQICILDSSFNPPNLAHKKIADLCLSHFPNCYLLLVLATGNADKPTVSTKDLQHRVNMIELIVEHEYMNQNVGIGLTTEPRFIDKAEVVKQKYPHNDLVFAMGFDTVIRLGMPQYYPAHGIDDVRKTLATFFSQTDVFVLTREEDGITTGPKMVATHKQEDELKESEVFKYFMDKIHVHMSGPDTFAVCSSAARQSKEGLERVCAPYVVNYVLKNNLY